MQYQNKNPVEFSKAEIRHEAGDAIGSVGCYEAVLRINVTEVKCLCCGHHYLANAERFLAGEIQALNDCPYCSGRCELCYLKPVCDLSCCIRHNVDIILDEVTVLAPVDPDKRPRYFGAEPPPEERAGE